MRRAPILAIVAALLVLAGCVDDSPIGGTGGGTVDVASPALVHLKQRAGIANCPASTATPRSGDALPDTTLPCLGGGRDVRLSGLQGPLLINLWGSYCAPCRDELPVLQQVHRAAGDKLTVLGIDYQDPSPGSALQLAADSVVTFPSVADPGADVHADLEVIALPQTVFVDPQGKIVATERRPLTSFDQAADLVRQHLGIDVGAGAAARDS